MSDAPQEPTAESLEVIRKFAETYAQRTGTYFCADPSVTAVVLKGLARHKDDLGGALCPCRHYEDKEAEVSQACLYTNKTQPAKGVVLITGVAL